MQGIEQVYTNLLRITTDPDEKAYLMSMIEEEREKDAEHDEINDVVQEAFTRHTSLNLSLEAQTDAFVNDLCSMSDLMIDERKTQEMLAMCEYIEVDEIDFAALSA